MRRISSRWAYHPDTESLQVHEVSRLRVAIDARLTPQVWGGVAHAAKALIQGLAELEGSERYTIIVSDDDQRDWISPHVGRGQQVVDSRDWYRGRSGSSGSIATLPAKALRGVKRVAMGGVRRVLGGNSSTEVQWPQVMVSDGFFESLGADVMHFPSQRFVLCAIPSVYNPHDLQHLHYPQFFTPHELARREVMYRHACQTARCVMVGSEWIKNDVVSSYGVDPARVQVIPEGAPTQFNRPPDVVEQEAVRAKLGLKDQYLLFPAMTWPHKNHLRLFEAMRRLRDDSGLIVNLVCTGARYEPFWPEIERGINALDLKAQVQFPGFLSESDLCAVYAMARAVVMPSLFEASSLPVFEAWQAGVPVASSFATALPEQMTDAALLFDPMNVDAIAAAVRRVLTDDRLRSELTVRGHARLSDFSWHTAAKAYRAVYRKTAGRQLTEEDRWLLSWESMRDAGSKPT